MSDPVPGQAPGDDEPLDELDPTEEVEDEPEEGEEPEPEEADADQGEDGEPERPQPAARPQRGSPRVQALANENRELKTKLSSFEQQLQGLLNERRQPSQAEIVAAQEAERQRFEMMSPYEQFQYSQQRITSEVERRTNQVAASMWEQNDQQQYEALLKETPAYRRLDDRVKELKAQAPGVPRRILLATAIGMRALEQGGAAKTRATRTAEAGTARQTARPSNARGDAAAPQGRRGSSLEERLRGQLI